MFISVPFQELFFRGMVQTRLENLLNPGLAIAIASLIFALVHFFNPILVALTLAGGLAWGYSFHRKRNLAGPILSHAFLGIYLSLYVM